MKKFACWFALVLLTLGASAQTLQENEKALRDSLIKQRFFLRGFSAQSEIDWRWDGNTLVQVPPALHSLGVLTPKSVSIKGDRVEIDGDRQILLRSGDKSFMLSQGKEAVRVVLDLKGADMSNMLPRLRDLIFYPDLKTALADLPEQYQGLLPAGVGVAAPKDKPKRCDCAGPRGVECSQQHPNLQMVGMKPPTVLTSVDPEFPASALADKVNKNVQIGLIVNTAGKPDFLWVASPGDSETDANALHSVSQYTFKPATCHGQPVAVDLFIDVNFQIH